MVAEAEKRNIDNVNYIFVSDEIILEMNDNYLKHNYCTDIISFDNSSSFSNISGEMYISIDTVKENAKYYNVDFYDELLRVMIHGLLHLCGYNDDTEAEIIKMREKEGKYISYFFEIKT